MGLSDADAGLNSWSLWLSSSFPLFTRHSAFSCDSSLQHCPLDSSTIYPRIQNPRDSESKGFSTISPAPFTPGFRIQGRMACNPTHQPSPQTQTDGDIPYWSSWKSSSSLILHNWFNILSFKHTLCIYRLDKLDQYLLAGWSLLLGDELDMIIKLCSAASG